MSMGQNLSNGSWAAFEEGRNEVEFQLPAPASEVESEPSTPASEEESQSSTPASHDEWEPRAPASEGESQPSTPAREEDSEWIQYLERLLMQRDRRFTIRIHAAFTGDDFNIDQVYPDCVMGWFTHDVVRPEWRQLGWGGTGFLQLVHETGATSRGCGFLTFEEFLCKNRIRAIDNGAVLLFSLVVSRRKVVGDVGEIHVPPDRLLDDMVTEEMVDVTTRRCHTRFLGPVAPCAYCPKVVQPCKRQQQGWRRYRGRNAYAKYICYRCSDALATRDNNWEIYYDIARRYIFRLHGIERPSHTQLVAAICLCQLMPRQHAAFVNHVV